MADWEEVRSWFPALDRWAYLNAASMSPVAAPVHAAMSAFLDRSRDDDPTVLVPPDHAEPLRSRVASYLGCDPDDIAFTASTSEGVLRAAETPDWRAGDNVVIPRGSFPAVVFPHLPLRARGVEVRLAGRPGAIWASEEEVIEAMDSRTRLVSVSWVSFVTGHRYDLEVLGRACRRSGALLCVDMIQGAGALRPCLPDLCVDMVALQPVKWVPAPSGLGVFYCRRELVAGSRNGHLGWTSARRRGLEGLTDYDLPLHAGARRYDAGSVSPVLVAGFEAALELLERAGPARIEERVLRLGRRLHDGLVELGHRVVTPAEPRARAGITTFQAADSGKVVARLREAGVVVAEREGRVRVSTHFYNNEGDVDRLLEALPPPSGVL